MTMMTADHCHQALKDKTAQYVTARWVVFILFLGSFLARTLLILKGFFVICYALGIVLAAQLAALWSPLNDLLPATTTAAASENVSDESDDHRHRRRVSEFQVWFASFRAVIVSSIFTLFPWFDVPVFWPILLFYFVGLVVFTWTRTLCERRSATTNEDDNGRGNNNTVQIHLVPRPGSNSTTVYYSITKIKPWSAMRTPPPYLKNISAPHWKSFLLDVEGAMAGDGKVARRSLAFLGQCFGFLTLGNIAFHKILESSFLRYHCTNPWKEGGCHDYRALWITLIVFGPVTIYSIVTIRSITKLQKKELLMLSERVKQICEEFHSKHPQISCEVKLLRRRVIQVEVGGVKNRAFNQNNDTTAIPNPQTSATDPLLQQQDAV